MTHNNYLWQEFKIKTFVSETIVFHNMIYRPELSTATDSGADKNIPIHIIYTGEISGENKIDIIINPENDKKAGVFYNNNIIDVFTDSKREIFLSVKIQNIKPAKLNIFVKNTGKNINFKGKILAQNFSNLEININGQHFAENTGILIGTRAIGYEKSITKLTGVANIEKNCSDCNSDIGFSAILSPGAQIEFAPKQFIKSAPNIAAHNASVYNISDIQIEYLRASGLGIIEINNVLRNAFMNDLMFFSE